MRSGAAIASAIDDAIGDSRRGDRAADYPGTLARADDRIKGRVIAASTWTC